MFFSPASDPPVLVANNENLRLTSLPLRSDCTMQAGATYRLRALTEGAQTTRQHAALIAFQLESPIEPDHSLLGLTISEKVGPYIYLNTGPGLHHTDRIFSVPACARSYSLMGWGDRGPCTLKTLHIEPFVQTAASLSAGTDYFLSFDVEALPGRAADDLLNRLVWGKTPGGEFGIRRICKILDEHGLRGNFLFDFSACTLYADREIGPIVDFLLAGGHALELHLHPEWVLRDWGLQAALASHLSFDQLPYELVSRVLEFGISKYTHFAKRVPKVFRAGGFRFNRETVLAARAQGVEALSNCRFQVSSSDAPGTGPLSPCPEPFRWGNGIIEIPVDYSPDPLSVDFQKYLGAYARAMRAKKRNVFNVVMHSWSLLHRDSLGFHHTFAPEYEHRLHQICAHVGDVGRAWTYADYVAARGSELAKVPLLGAPTVNGASTLADDSVECSICNALLAKRKLEGDTCRGCGSRARHRQLKDVFGMFGNLFHSKTVIACHATPLERRIFLSRVERLFNFDVRPIADADAQMDIQDMNLIPDGSFDCFFALHVLNHVKDDVRALEEIHRVLKEGGVLVTTVPYRENEPTTSCENVTEHYGAAALEQYGVGSYRRYGLADFLALLGRYFLVASGSGYDAVSNTSARVFFATRLPSSSTL